MKYTKVIIALLVLLSTASLAEAQVVVSQTTASTARVHEKSGREKGWVIRPEFESGWGLNSGPLLVGINGTMAYQINPYFAFGGGLRYDYDIKYDQTNASWMPIFANARAYFCDRKWSPFFDIIAGFNIPIIKGARSYGPDIATEKAIGFTTGGTIGVQFKGFDLGFSGCIINVSRFSKGYHLVGGIEEYSYYEYNNIDMSYTISIAYNFQLSKK